MAGKKGLTAERAFLTDWWQEERRLVLLHDLTSCLSIGDATSFTQVGDEFEALWVPKTTSTQVKPHVDTRG